MDIVRLRIPYGFIRDRARVGWRDLRFGLVNELVDPQAPVELAMEQVASAAAPSAALLDLAAADATKPTRDLIERLALEEAPQSDAEVSDKWLYLVLAWLYEHRRQLSDPLGEVEHVYADFGYPERIAPFVRYMPMEGPDLGSHQANERRLFERWKRYVEEVAPKYSR